MQNATAKSPANGKVNPVPEKPSAPEAVFTPALDIHETPVGLVVAADLPGVKSENLRVNVKDNGE